METIKIPVYKPHQTEMEENQMEVEISLPHFRKNKYSAFKITDNSDWCQEIHLAETYSSGGIGRTCNTNAFREGSVEVTAAEYNALYKTVYLSLAPEQ